jgi:hypothetical protein
LPTTTVIRAGFAGGESAWAQAAARQNNNAGNWDWQADTRDLPESCQSIRRDSPKEMLCVDDGLMTIVLWQRDRNMPDGAGWYSLSTPFQPSYTILSPRFQLERRRNRDA